MNYITDLIPLRSPIYDSQGKPHYRRPGNKIKFDYITIHNTGNTSSVAKGERSWLTNKDNTVIASYHLVIDQINCIECVPTGVKELFPNTSAAENAWHAGDGTGSGNMASLGIEICESGDFSVTMKNAVEVVSRLLKALNLSIDRVKPHQFWSGKNCPRLLLANGGALWKKFINDVQVALNKLNASTPAPKPTVTTNTSKLEDIYVAKEGKIKLDQSQYDLGVKAIDYLADNGLLYTRDAWKQKVDEYAPIWVMFEMNKRVHDSLLKEINKLKIEIETLKNK